MSESQPPTQKVFLHKPKKGSIPSGGGNMGESVRVPQQPQPVPVKAPLWYRYRAGVGALLLVNLGIGGYVLSRPRPEIDAKLLNPEKRAAPEEKQESAPTQAVAEEPEWVPPSKASISEDEQRQVLQWVLDERRKVKGVNKAEKARIDEEKRVIKHLLRESHLPPLV